MKSFSTYASIISGLLIFSGYINYESYYSFFNIDISSYLSTGELLLSFLPLTVPILGIAGLLLFVLFFMTLNALSNEKDKKEDLKNEKVITNVFHYFKDSVVEFFKLLREKKVNIFNRIYSLIVSLISILFNLSIILFFIIFIVCFLVLALGKELFSNFNIPLIIAFSFIWFIILLYVIKIVTKKFVIHKYYTNYVKILFFIFIFFGLIYINNRKKATLVLKGKPEFEVNFNYNKEPIKTDSNLVFIGKTNEYLFLRNLYSGSNKVYNFKDIECFEIKKSKLKMVYYEYFIDYLFNIPR